MNFISRLIILLLISFFLYFIPISFVNAKPAPPCQPWPSCGNSNPTPTLQGTCSSGCVTIQNPFPNMSLPLLISSIISKATVIFYFVVGVVLTSLFIWAGYLYMIDAGNEENAKKAKKIMTSAVIGAVIIGCASTIALLMQTLLHINLGF